MENRQTKKIRILRIIARLNVGGPAIHTVLLTDRLNNDKFESKLIAGQLSEGEGDMSYLAKERNVVYEECQDLQRELSPIKDIKALLKMWKIIRTYQPDIIHTHTAKAGFIGRSAALLYNLFKNEAKRIRVVHTFHGHVFHSYFSPLKTNLFLFLERFLGRYTDTIITITPLQKQEILSLGVGKEIQHQIVPLGLDLKRFYIQPRDNGILKGHFEIPSEKKLIGVVARFTAIKNLTLFLETAAELLKNFNDIHFVMVGDGEEMSLLKEKAEALNITSSVTFTGFLKELHLVYADLDLVMLTSHNEGSPVSIIEAMTAGVPVVASAVGGVPDLFQKDFHEMLCPANDKDALVKACAKILKDHIYRNAFIDAHQNQIYQKYSFDRLSNDLSGLYQNLVS
ncbi:glycosyltransferase [Algivirga pacifica]|uniref:Glycosyltransferase family 4 protein n=1 Tax=Algivirga pacifica TaxID=1162670 RepID=A0ABP9DLH0_9BACT